MKGTKQGILAAVFISLLVLLGGRSRAAVTVVDIGSNQTAVSIDPITFSITSSLSDVGFLVFEDFWSVSSTNNGAPINPTAMTVSINGGSAAALTQYFATGRLAVTYATIDQNDLYFDFNGVADQLSVLAGDTVTIGGSFTFSGNLDGIERTSGPYQSSLINDGGQVAGSTSVVPEPSRIMLVILGGLVMAMRRGRRKL